MDIERLLNRLANLAQLIDMFVGIAALLIGIGAWLRPGHFHGRRLSLRLSRWFFLSLALVLLALLIVGGRTWPSIAARLAVAGLTLLLVLLLLRTERRHITWLRRPRQVHNETQWKRTSEITVGSSTDGRALEMDDIFVEPRLRNTARLDSDACDEPERTPRGVLRHAWDKDSRQIGVVVWGMAGSGKSVLAKWLVHEIARGDRPERWLFLQRRMKQDLSKLSPWGRRAYDRRSRLLRCLGISLDEYDRRFPYPFWIKLHSDHLKQAQGNEEAILGLLRDRVQKAEGKSPEDSEDPGDGSSLTVDVLARDGLIMPVFDGFDELTPEAQDSFRKALECFFEKYPGNGPFVLTSREPVRLWKDQGVAHWQILAFNESQVGQYLDRYYRKSTGDIAKAARDAILKTATPRLRQLLTEPLLLSMVVSLFDPNHLTPIGADRVTIYRRYLEELKGRIQTRSARLIQAETPCTGDPYHRLGAVAYRGMRARQQSFLVEQMSADEVCWFNDLKGRLTWHDARTGQYSFAHITFQAYLAAEYLADLIRKGPEKDAERLWAEAVDRSLPASAKSTQPASPPIEVSPADELWCSYWRDVLVFCGVELAHEPFVVEQVLAMKQQCMTAQAHVLSLRLVNAIQERDPSKTGRIRQVVTQEEAIQWMLALASPQIPSNWQRDVLEAGYLLDSKGWNQLAEKVRQPEVPADVLALLGALHDERAADLLIGIALKRASLPAFTFDAASASDPLGEAIRAVGWAAVGPLVESYRRAEFGGVAEWQSAVLVRLMGYAGYAEDIAKILLGIVDARRKAPKALAAEAYRSLARLGHAEGLSRCLRQASKAPPLDPRALVEACAALPIEDELLRDFNHYLHREGLQNDLVVQIIQRKLSSIAPCSDHYVFKRILKEQLAEYQAVLPSGARGVLTWLQNRFLANPVTRDEGSRMGKFYRGLFAALWAVKGPSKYMLRSILRICAAVDDDLARQWIETALYDPCREVWADASDAFVARSERMTKLGIGDGLRWLEKLRGSLREGVVREIERGLGKQSVQQKRDA